MADLIPSHLPDDVEMRAARMAGTMRALGNERRVMIVCQLLSSGEMPVTQLSAAVGLSQSALSQHLAKMKAEGIVEPRRAGQSVYYRVADARVERLMQALYEVFND